MNTWGFGWSGMVSFFLTTIRGIQPTTCANETTWSFFCYADLKMTKLGDFGNQIREETWGSVVREVDCPMTFHPILPHLKIYWHLLLKGQTYWHSIRFIHIDHHVNRHNIVMIIIIVNIIIIIIVDHYLYLWLSCFIIILKSLSNICSASYHPYYCQSYILLLLLFLLLLILLLLLLLLLLLIIIIIIINPNMCSASYHVYISKISRSTTCSHRLHRRSSRRWTRLPYRASPHSWRSCPRKAIFPGIYGSKYGGFSIELDLSASFIVLITVEPGDPKKHHIYRFPYSDQKMDEPSGPSWKVKKHIWFILFKIVWGGTTFNGLITIYKPWAGELVNWIQYIILELKWSHWNLDVDGFCMFKDVQRCSKAEISTSQ